MHTLKHIRLVIIISAPALCTAQSATDCPTWANKHKNTKSGYLKYLRENQGKKVKKDSIYFPEIKQTAETAKKTTVESSTENKTHTPAQNQDQKKESIIVTKETLKTETISPDEKPLITPVNEQVAIPIETPLTTPSNTQQKEQPSPVKEPENTGYSPEKKQPSKFKKKLVRLFTKKNNKAPKPNYKKCATAK